MIEADRQALRGAGVTDLREAFGEVYETYVDRVYRFVYRKTRDRATAEDITSDVFLKALQAIDRYEDRGQPISAWLYSIARHAIIDHYRQRTAENIDDLELSDGFYFEERVARRVEVRRIGALIGELPPLQREALVLYFQSDLSQAEIATAMSKTRGAVQLLVHRGVTRLREVA